MNFTPDQLMRSAKSMYVNDDRLGEWNKVDPKDARIMALATEVRELLSAAKAAASTGNASHLSKNLPKYISVNANIVEGTKPLKKWRTVNVGSTVKVDGTIYS